MSATKVAPRTFYPSGFDVTAVIGRVEFSNLGEHETPFQAALAVIGQHSPRVGNDPVIYVFPHEDGGNIEVEVRTTDSREPA